MARFLAVSCALLLGSVSSQTLLSTLYDAISGRDGALSESDLINFWEHTRVAHPKSSSVSSATFRKMDSNGDGVVSLSEFNAFYPRLATMKSDSHEPSGVHLMLTGNLDEMRVMWVTLASQEYNGAPIVEYGSSPGVYDSTSRGNSTTYRVPERWWGNFEGNIHNVVMSHLRPGQRYYYRVGGSFSGQMVWSSEFSFKAAPLSSSSQPTRLSIFGDMGVVPLGFAVTDLLVKNLPSFDADLVMHAGDISYAGIASNIPILNITKEDEITFVWDMFAHQVEPIAATRPYMTGVGNHESFYDYAAFRHRWQMPGAESGGNGNMWFSYDYGNIHVTSMSTELDYTVGSAQWRWIENDLARARANPRTPWIMFVGHRPMYCSNKGGWNDQQPGAPFQRNVEQLLVRYRVDLTLTGHDHCYERIHPNVNGTVTRLPTGRVATYTAPGAPLHLVVGTAGALMREDWVVPQPAWSAVRMANELRSLGTGQLTLHNGTHLHFAFKGLDGGTGDEFWLVK